MPNILRLINQTLSTQFPSLAAWESYQKVLNLYWDKHTAQECIHQIGACLEDAWEKPKEAALYYRLWIEVLAREADRVSLQALLAHLRHYASIQTSIQPSIQASSTTN
jgi:hypothetical protein